MLRRLNTISDIPIIVSMGDPCGIGPEIIAKSWLALRNNQDYAFAAIGDISVFEAFGLKTVAITSLSHAKTHFSTSLPVLHRPLSHRALVGTPRVNHAPHIISWINEAFHLCLNGEASALVTAPIAKSILYEAGFSFPGHTEFLGALAEQNGFENKPVMLLKADRIRVALTTIHIPISEISSTLDINKITTLGRIIHDSMNYNFGIARPRIAVAALNPHAGESGTIGREEIETISPAIEHLKALGIDATGPHPADTLFYPEALDRYDVVLCMYHDQALIPLKTLDFWGGVNITLNLPIIRTSPDHGTGFNLAGKNLARADSMINAIQSAYELSQSRKSQSQ